MTVRSRWRNHWFFYSRPYSHPVSPFAALVIFALFSLALGVTGAVKYFLNVALGWLIMMTIVWSSIGLVAGLVFLLGRSKRN